MHETYRMLGSEHEADLEREAARRAQRALLPVRAPLTKRIAVSIRRGVSTLGFRIARQRRTRTAPSREVPAP